MATMTSKGRVTVPAEIRRKLGLREGSVADFIEVRPGEFRLVTNTGSASDLAGMFTARGRASLEDMERGIAQGAAASAGLWPGSVPP
ncbi:MAG: AbrB/MazE/SpoVT family DNA-binding domain-containing protein [Bifidobacteriaceae bacterium]|jgi:AbrB family looped-hinge helix DNA binding protein|nr:AbrB/MazE/SpoVT family DNA-binding domain-containing protein [Bifidobacteriaceae bacterium]